MSELASESAAEGSYGRLLRVPVLRGLALADVCARLPQGMVTVTLLLTAAVHASMATAGLVVTGYTLGQAVTGPARGRLADRRGLAIVCAVCGALYAVALLGLLAASLARGPAWLLVAAAAVAGLSCPPLSPGMRSLWSAHAGGPLRQAAFALDAAVFDLAYITGPVLASSLAAGLSPAAPVIVLLVLTGAATVIIARRTRRPQRTMDRWEHGGTRNDPLSRDRAGQPVARSRLGPLTAPGLRRLLLTGALANAALSGTEVALTGYVRQHHALWASGPLLAELSLGSIAGSLLLGARAAGAGAAEERRRLPWMLACYSAGLAVLAAAALRAPLVAVAAPLAGLCLGPTLATLFSLASSAAPGRALPGVPKGSAETGGGTEAQAWLNSAMNGGAAAGAALAGLTVGVPALSLAVTAGVAALAAGTAGQRPRGPGAAGAVPGACPRRGGNGGGTPP